MAKGAVSTTQETTIFVGQSDALHPNADIEKRLARIYRLNRNTIDLRLERSPYAVLLERLGNPHLDVPPIIHVAGTNGKGSTIAFINSTLKQAGYKTHLYTSPHLTLFNERIVLDGDYVSDEELIKALDYINEVNGDNPVTFFEYTTALAFYLFSKHKGGADFLLLEVGMGGRLDCTNIIKNPLCTVITKIGLDHVQYLGDTAAKIAYEKGCIMKSERPCVIGVQEQKFATETYEVFENLAAERDVALIYADTADNSTKLGLVGAHQYENAGTAMAVAKLLRGEGYNITSQNIENGLATASWHGRMEVIQKGEFCAEVSARFGISRPDIYVDGGHNVCAAGALAATFAQWKEEAFKRPIIMFLGMGYDKDINGFLEVVYPFLDAIYLLNVKAGLHPQSAEDLMTKIAPSYKDKIALYDEPPRIENHSDMPPHFIVCGSLFLYGYVTA